MWHVEEVELVLEEMHWVSTFLKWDQEQWKSRARHSRQRVDSITHSPTPLPAQGKAVAFEEGLSVYALCQASVRHCLFSTFAWPSAEPWCTRIVAMADQGLAEEEVAVDNAM